MRYERNARLPTAPSARQRERCSTPLSREHLGVHQQPFPARHQTHSCRPFAANPRTTQFVESFFSSLFLFSVQPFSTKTRRSSWTPSDHPLASLKYSSVSSLKQNRCFNTLPFPDARNPKLEIIQRFSHVEQIY